MKQLTCEMCGSKDLIKQDGVFVCQCCGCKYSVEEAKNMMIEGTVDVSGSTVKVDTTDELANLYQIARRARDDNNSANAAKYYDMILVKDPTSWEAAFFVVYFKAMTCKIAEIRSASISVDNCLSSVLGLIRDNVPEEDQAVAVKEVVVRSQEIAMFMAKAAHKHYMGIDYRYRSNHSYTSEYINRVGATRDLLFTCGTQVEHYFGGKDAIAPLAADAWKLGLKIHTTYLNVRPQDEEAIASYEKSIAKYDPSYYCKYAINKLESEIRDLKLTIDRTPTTFEGIESAKKANRVLGIAGVIAGLCLFFVGMSLGEFLICFIALIGGGCGIYAMNTGSAPTSNQDVTANSAKVQEAKAKIDEKQAELDRLQQNGPTKAITKTPVSAPAKPIATDASKKWLCTSCGSENSHLDIICQHCGMYK